MEKKLITLTNDEIRTGQIITERAKGHLAAFEALRATEQDYQNILREKYGLGPEYLVVDWMQGLEAIEQVSENVEATAHDKDN